MSEYKGWDNFPDRDEWVQVCFLGDKEHVCESRVKERGTINGSRYIIVSLYTVDTMIVEVAHMSSGKLRGSTRNRKNGKHVEDVIVYWNLK